MSDLYAAAIAGLEGYIDAEEEDTRLGEAVAKVGKYTFAMQENGGDDIGERKSRLARLEGDLQASSTRPPRRPPTARRSRT